MQKIYAGVKAIIVKDNKFLIIKEVINNKPIWDIPGGKIEYGETPQETLKREIKEEIFLDIEIISLIGLFWFYRIANKNQTICNTFLCKPITDKIDLTKNPAPEENILEYKWVTPKEYLQNYSENQDKSFYEIIKNLKL